MSAFTPMNGLETLRASAELPPERRPASIGTLIGMTVDVLEKGHVELSLVTRPDMRNPMGTLHGGICATLLDSALGTAVHTTLTAGASYTTLEIKVNYVRTVPTDGRRITAKGDTIHVGRRVATAEGTVVGEDGKLLAHATTTCLISPPAD